MSSALSALCGRQNTRAIRLPSGFSTRATSRSTSVSTAVETALRLPSPSTCVIERGPIGMLVQSDWTARPDELALRHSAEIIEKLASIEMMVVPSAAYSTVDPSSRQRDPAPIKVLTCSTTSAWGRSGGPSSSQCRRYRVQCVAMCYGAPGPMQSILGKMTRVAIITHKFDKFLRRSYLLGSILKEVEQAGIEVEVTHGHRGFVKADLAILHVDATVVDPEYTALARRYPRTINLRIRDIRKSLISGAALSRGESWDGPVIVKTELNARGAPEFYHNEVAALRGKPAPHPRVTALRDYILFDRVGDVPEQVWRDPQLVVEKFMPERDPRGFALRTWCFMAAARPARAASAPIRSSREPPSSHARWSPCRMNCARSEARLGFDYGKFDFVLHDGRPVLFDANFTPTVPENLSEELSLSAKELALGLLEMIELR